jgi:hypothetical protein
MKNRAKALLIALTYTIQRRGILIIGNLHELDTYAKRTTFELFRRNLRNPDVFTFDELLARSKHLLLNEEGSLRLERLADDRNKRVEINGLDEVVVKSAFA